MGADIQASGSGVRANLPLHINRAKSNVTRTTSPLRPEWLDAIKRPLRIMAWHQRQLDLFAANWKLHENEIRRVADFDQLRGVSTATPLLLLPTMREELEGMMPEMNPVFQWERRGGMVIDIPQSAMTTGIRAKFDDDFNLCASTIVELAKARHLDSLNRKS